MVYNKLYYDSNKDIINYQRRLAYKENKSKWYNEYYIKHSQYIKEIHLCRYYQYIKEEKNIKKVYPSFELWEDKIIKKYFSKLSYDDIRIKYLPNRSNSSIYTRGKKLGLKTRYINRSKFIRMYNQSWKGKKYEEIFGFKKSLIFKDKLRKNMLKGVVKK